MKQSFTAPTNLGSNTNLYVNITPTHFISVTLPLWNFVICNLSAGTSIVWSLFVVYILIPSIGMAFVFSTRIFDGWYALDYHSYNMNIITPGIYEAYFLFFFFPLHNIPTYPPKKSSESTCRSTCPPIKVLQIP